MSKVFFREKDRRFLAKRNANFYRESMSPLDIHFPPKTLPDDFLSIYRESQSDQLLTGTTVHSIPCHLLMNPPESEWQAAGIDEPRSIKISFSKEILDRGYLPKGSKIRVPFPWPDRGCLVVVEERLYYFTEIRSKSYFGGTENWYLRICWGVRHYPSSLTDNMRVEPGTDKPPVDIIWP